jgi:proteasome lid subunit RPN8/RPN11
VLKDGSVVECRNVSEDPSKDVFVAHPDDIERYCDDVAATWHTHPATSKHDATLSADDWSMFVQWPEDVVHFIVGAMTIRGYRVRKGAVIDS